MNSDLSLAALGRASSKFLHRYHIILFVVIAFGGLAVITFLLNATISKASEAAPPQPTNDIDQATIKKIEQLKTASESDQSASQLPISSRNPFVE
jgi:hypothetical protein